MVREDSSITDSTEWRRLSVLLLCDDCRGHANTVLDHIDALTKFSAHDVHRFNPVGMTKSRCLDLNEFDVVVIHYSLVIISDRYLSSNFREQIRRFQGLKIQFIQDEYRRVEDFTSMMRYLGIHVLLSLLSVPEINQIYDEARLPGVRKFTTLAGYVPEGLLTLHPPPIENRELDIGYRGRTVPYWLGRLGYEKALIGEGVLAQASKYNLRCDIAWAEQDRIYGQRWNQFLMGCKATLGTESGASITDFDGSLERKTKAYLAEHPCASFDDVYRNILEPYEGNVRVTAVSPRIFEAAALRTAMILFQGEYSGTIKPWVHYIPLAKDFSNMDHVVEQLRDVQFLQFITENARRDLVDVGRYSQRALAQQFDELVSAYGRPIGSRRKFYYRLSCLDRRCVAAASSVGAFARPALYLLQCFVKGCVSLALMLKRKAGVEILFSYVKNKDFREAVSFNQILKDILKIAVVGKARAAALMDKAHYTVSVRFERDTGRLLFESLPLNGARPPAWPMTANQRHQPIQEQWSSSSRLAERTSRIRKMIWNHSALGGDVRYALTSWITIDVGMGGDDIHSFEGFVGISRFAPEQAWDFILPFINANQHPGARSSNAMVRGA